MRRAVPVLPAVAALALVLGTGTRDASASCAATVTWRGVDYVGWAARSALAVGDSLGTGTVPACRDTIVVGGGARPPERGRSVDVLPISGVPARVAVAIAGGARTAYLAPGYLPQLREHPLHRALYGRADRPLETLGRRCGDAPAVRGRLVGAEPGGLRVRRETGGTKRMLVDVRTRVAGLERDGLPYLTPGARVRVETLRCDPSAELVARSVLREGSSGESRRSPA
jgi:hypothetical protein